ALVRAIGRADMPGVVPRAAGVDEGIDQAEVLAVMLARGAGAAWLSGIHDLGPARAIRHQRAVVRAAQRCAVDVVTRDEALEVLRDDRDLALVDLAVAVAIHHLQLREVRAAGGVGLAIAL